MPLPIRGEEDAEVRLMAIYATMRSVADYPWVESRVARQVRAVLELAGTDAGQAKLKVEVFGALDAVGARANLEALEKQKAELEAKLAQVVTRITDAKAELAKIEGEEKMGA